MSSPLPAVAARVDAVASGIAEKVVALRRQLHAFPEQGFTEFRTAAQVAEALAGLGYRVRVGADVLVAADRFGVPPAEEISAAWQEADAAGAPRHWLESMRGGLTGVVADLETGRSGPTVAFRFDIDALPIAEAGDPGHLPAAGGFASRRPGNMHACGHDGHTAIGLGLAAVAAELAPILCGRLRLIFQPAEEGGRGGKAMVSAGVCEGVDDLICMHLGLGVPTGEVVGGATEFLASTRFAARFQGISSHAGLAPEAGRSAIVAAAAAVLALHSLPQHAGGRTRVNVGKISGGTATNIVAPEAVLEFETRSDVTAVNEYLVQRARAAVLGAAATYECTVDLSVKSQTPACDSTPDLAAVVAEEAARLPEVRKTQLHRSFGASEDATYLMAEVQRLGGRATYALVGADLAATHHNERFDFAESALSIAVRTLARTLLRLGHCR